MNHKKQDKQQMPTAWELEPLPAWDLSLPEHLFTGLPHWDEAQLPPWTEELKPTP